MFIFSLAVVVVALLAILDFLQNKSCKMYLGPMLPPGANVTKLFITVIYHHSMIIPSFCAIKLYLPWKLLWNGSKLLRYINPRKNMVIITVVIYRCIVL
jgi:hypothetical protein